MGSRLVAAARLAGLTPVAALDAAPVPYGVEAEPGLAPIVTATLPGFFSKRPAIVAIATTADSHIPLLEACLSAGISRVLVEKPVGCSVSECDRAIARATASGALVLVNHNNRCWQPLQAIRALDGSEQTGRLRAIIITQGAGGLGSLGTHYFDLANWLFGATPSSSIATVTRPEAPNPRGVRFDDVGGTVIATTADGRRLVLDIGDDTGVIGGYELRYERARLVMPFTGEPPRLYVRRADVRDRPKHFYGAPLVEVPVADGFRPADIVAASATLLGELRDGILASGADLAAGRAALETMVAARLSAERGVAIALPLAGVDRERQFVLS